MGRKDDQIRIFPLYFSRYLIHNPSKPHPRHRRGDRRKIFAAEALKVGMRLRHKLIVDAAFRGQNVKRYHVEQS